MVTKVQKISTPLYHYKAPLSISSMGSWKEKTPPPHHESHQKNGITGPLNLRILTYNVWFDAHFKNQRTKALLEAAAKEDPDVCCFQEVTSGFEGALRQHPFWKKTYTMTSLGDQTKLTKSWYGTMIMVKKAWLEKGGFDVSACFVDFPGSTTGRMLTMLEVSRGGLSRTLRLGTVHLDYTPELRAAHMEVCMRALGGSDPNASGILCGDTNMKSYAEFDQIRAAGWEDAWPAIHPQAEGETVSEGSDLLTLDPTYGKYGIRVDGGTRPLNGREFPRRLDVTLCKGLTIKACKLVGDQPLSKAVLQAGTPGEVSDEFTVWPSDHVGVCTDVEWALE